MKKIFTNIRKNSSNGESGYVINNAGATMPPQAPGSGLIEPKSHTLSSLEWPPKVSEQSDLTLPKRCSLNGDSTFLKQLTKAHSNSSLSTFKSKTSREGQAEDRPLSGDDFFEGTILEFPEIGMLVDELESRLKALENVLSTAESADVVQASSDAKRKVEITSEQLDAINGISTNVRGLLHCLNHHHNNLNSQRKIRREQKDGSYSRRPRRHSSHDVSPRSTRSHVDAASISSSKLLLHNAVEPEKSHWRHCTVFSSNSGMNFTDMDSTSKIPKELLLRMINLEPTAVGRSSVAYIAQTYGGVQLPTDFGRGLKSLPSFKNVAKQVGRAKSFVFELQRSVSEKAITGAEYIPTEFKRLSFEKRKQLARMLSWESLKVWGFNAFQLDKLSTIQWIGCDKGGATKDSPLESFDKVQVAKVGCPIVLMGWALLASPYAQLAMAREVNDAELIEKAKNAIRKKAQSKDYPLARTVLKKFSMGAQDDEADDMSTEEEGYFFLDKFEIMPDAICHFLRKVEKDYPTRGANPYHNNIHAADVMQTTHALIQMGNADFFCAFSCLEIFTILLAAVLHDVRHPGTNNNYQINKQTDLAMLYNDHSVLENMHASRASYLLRESGGSANTEDTSEGIFGKLTEKERAQLRAGVIRSILSTDMSQHFKVVAKMKTYIDKVMDDIDNESSGSVSVLSVLWRNEHTKLREKLLPFILHLADISNPTKSPDISIEWSNSAYDEFFLQGDKEAIEGMPISPLCDRSTTNPADGQVGFITYVVKPAFLLLQQCLPGIDGILTQVRCVHGAP
eukprot:CCRYP_003068-RB/>CCRYP_003068-RB protein AED:0.07 eAED:0.07 QI:485/1/1/1/0.5/0.66/3/427/793